MRMTLSVLVAVLWLFVAQDAKAQVHPCAVVGEAAVSARALAVEGVPRDQAEKIMLHWFSPDKHGEFYRMIDAAFRDKRKPAEFATAAIEACIGGRMPAFLGIGA